MQKPDKPWEKPYGKRYKKPKISSALFLGLLILSSIFITGSVSAGSAASEENTGSFSETFLNQEADFAISLLLNAAGTEIRKGENAMVSPLSVAEALGLTSSGAVGKTKDQMLSVFAGGLDQDAFNSYVKKTNERLSESKKTKVNIANAIWIRKNFSLLESYRKTAKSYYKAHIHTDAAFNAETVKDVNNWVNKETKGMISHIVDQFSENTVMELVNAVAFEGKWKLEYQKDQIWKKQNFKNAAGKTEKVTMLRSTESFYVKLKNGSGFVKPYQDGDLMFMCLLPRKGMSTEEFLQSLTGKKLRDAFRNRQYIFEPDVLTVTMPEFQAEYRVILNKALKKMGMRNPFTDQAVFNMTEPNAGLRISNVLHVTYIEVNRKGTKAAAVTAVEMDGATATPIQPKYYSVTLDRPFVYAIMDQKTALPVFLGVVNTVSS